MYFSCTDNLHLSPLFPEADLTSTVETTTNQVFSTFNSASSFITSYFCVWLTLLSEGQDINVVPNGFGQVLSFWTGDISLWFPPAGSDIALP